MALLLNCTSLEQHRLHSAQPVGLGTAQRLSDRIDRSLFRSLAKTATLQLCQPAAEQTTQAWPPSHQASIRSDSTLPSKAPPVRTLLSKRAPTASGHGLRDRRSWSGIACCVFMARRSVLNVLLSNGRCRNSDHYQAHIPVI